MDVLEKFKKFESRSRSAFSELHENMKNDRMFMAGNTQWTKDDDSFVETTRNRITMNVIANQCHSVANSYSSFAYTWITGKPEIDREVDEFFKVDSNRYASEEALLGTVSFGLGVMALGSDMDSSGKVNPVIYSVTNPDRVLLDPDSVDLDSSDAMEGALVDYRSRDWVRVHMGDEFLPDKDAKMIVTSASCSEKVPIITYYYLEKDGCHVATFVNDRQVDSYDSEGNVVESIIPIHRIPIWPVWGELTWTDDDKEIYCGLVSKAKTVQRIVNYSVTALMERLAMSPKPQWRGYAESFKGLDKYYKKAGTGVNPIIPAQRLANDNTTVLPLPERVDNTVQFGDLNGIVDGSLNMLTSITGVDSKGLADAEGDITATAVMYTSKVFQNNIKHYMNHLRTVMKNIGDTVMVLLGHPEIKVDVGQGPEAAMEMQTARQELTALVGVVEPNQKPALVNAILKTHPDNEILAQLYVDLNSMQAPTPMEMEMQQTCEMMKQAIDEKDQEIMSLTSQVEDLRQQVQNTDKDKIFQLRKMELEHQYAQEDAILKAQLDAGLDADRAAIDNRREVVKMQYEAEKAAIDTEMARQKLATQQASDEMKLQSQAIDNMNKLTQGAMNGEA